MPDSGVWDRTYQRNLIHIPYNNTSGLWDSNHQRNTNLFWRMDIQLEAGNLDICLDGVVQILWLKQLNKFIIEM